MLSSLRFSEKVYFITHYSVARERCDYSMNTNNNTQPTSYGVIIFWIIIFWPYGTYLLVRNLQNSKAAVINGSDVPRNVAFVLFGIAALLLAVGASDPEAREMIGLFIVIGIGFAAGGFYLLKVFNDTKNLSIEFKKYVAAVVNGKLTRIVDIAYATGVTADIAEYKLQRMIELDIFKGAYIDRTTGVFVLNTSQVQPNVEHVSVACRSCGAENSVVKGNRGVCKYCDSAL